MDRNGLGHSYDPGALKITISKFYRPSGASTQLKGVASDIVLPSLSDLAEVSESSLKDPLPWDVVPSADYEHLDQVRPYLPELSADSSRRVAAEKGFTYLRDNMTRLKKNLEAKSVSLNEAVRRKEMAEAKVRQKEYEKENLAVRASMPTTYNITLKNVELPGLPQPLPHTNSVAIASNEIAAKSRNEPSA